MVLTHFFTVRTLSESGILWAPHTYFIPLLVGSLVKKKYSIQYISGYSILVNYIMCGERDREADRN